MTDKKLHKAETGTDDIGPLLEVDDLRIGLRRGRSTTSIVDGVSFDVRPRTSFGIVGESGSGKSLTLRAIAGLLPTGTEVLTGSIRYRGTDLVTAAPAVRRSLMGPEIAMIFQEPMTALNPVRPVGDQIAEGPRRHLGLSKRDGRALALEMMGHTGIPDPARRVNAFPHELSGGLRQRVMIAMALACRPKLLLCDEPTTALDVTVQHQVLTMLETLTAEVGAALVFVTHDLAVVNQTCSDLAVMYAGRIVESGRTRELLGSPRHPYTRGLLDSAPDFDRPGRMLVPIPGLPPSITARPPGCAFAPRCSRAIAECDDAAPVLTRSGDRAVACFAPESSESEVSA